MVKKTSPRGASPFRGIGKKAKARMKRGERAKSAIKLPSRSSRKDPMEKVEAAAGVAQRALADLIAVGRAALAEGKEAWPDEVVTRLLDGENPVRVFREYRGISQTALAKAAKMNQGSPQRHRKRNDAPGGYFAAAVPHPRRFHGNPAAKIIIDAGVRRSWDGSSRVKPSPAPACGRQSIVHERSAENGSVLISMLNHATGMKLHGFLFDRPKVNGRVAVDNR